MASRLFNLRQGARPVPDLTVGFRTLTAKSRWNTEALVTTSHQGLSNSIKDELAARELREDLESLIMLAIRLDNRIQEGMRQRSFDTPPAFWFPGHPKPPSPAWRIPYSCVAHV